MSGCAVIAAPTRTARVGMAMKAFFRRAPSVASGALARGQFLRGLAAAQWIISRR